MAIGMSGSQRGGVIGVPDVPGLGEDQWAIMSGANPSNPLIAGYAGSPGYGTGQRKISTSPNPMATLSTGAPMSKHWSGVFDLKNNPSGWVLLLALGYWAMHKFKV